MLLAPIGNPEPRDFTPLDTPHIFLKIGTHTVQMQFDTFLRKYKTAVISILARMKIYSGFLSHSQIENVIRALFFFLLFSIFPENKEEDRSCGDSAECYP